MFLSLGRLVQGHRWWVIACWTALVLASLPLAPRLTAALRSGGFASDGLEAARARVVLEEKLGLPPVTLVVVFQSVSLTADDQRFQEAVERTLQSVRLLPGVVSILSPALDPRQVSKDKHTAYATIGLDPGAGESGPLVASVKDRLRDDTLTVLVSGAPIFYADIERLSERDLRRAEIVAFPLGLLALILVLGSVVAATVPVLVGGAGVVAALAVLFLVGQAVELSVFVMNMATMLGLGLSIDYALFLTSRFREELGNRSVDDAVVHAVAQAGRAVFFSALTVLTGLLGLVMFDSMVLRSLGFGGAIVVAFAGLAALTLLPAILAVLGRRANALSLPRLPAIAIRLSWLRLASAVMLHPIRVVVPVLAFLLFLGWPFLEVRLSAADASMLPLDTPSRQGLEALDRVLEGEAWAPVMVVVQAKGDILSAENVGEVYGLTQRIAQDPRVARVDSIVSLDPRLSREQYQLLYRDSARHADPYARAVASALAAGDTTLINVVPKYAMATEESKALVRAIRVMAPPASLQLLVGGGTASIVDYVDSLYADLPRAIAIIVAVTYLVLLFVFRSVVLPLKAILMNTLSLLASYGALVFIFQQGHFADLLGFTPAGFVEASLPILLFCFLFGVSMDYEVFLLSRIRECYLRTRDNRRAVAEGLEKSGRIITSAALIVVVVSGSFVTADIVLVKALGLGTAVAVFLDATVVRALLVPATMRLLGRANWWLPGRSALPATAAATNSPMQRTVRLPESALRGVSGRFRRPSLRTASIACSALGILALAIFFAARPAVPQAQPVAADTLDSTSQLVSAARALPPISLPADDLPHANLTEWWYYTGHLRADDGDSYGFEFVVFQSVRGASLVGYAAHFAVTDRSRRQFRYDQRAAIADVVDRTDLSLELGDWQLVGDGAAYRLAAQMPGYAIALDLVSTKPPMLHQGDGTISFGPAGDSYYYSRPRLLVSGKLTAYGSERAVSGSAWMDHQWGDFLVINQGGWDWFATQLSDGSDLTVSIVRSPDGLPILSYGTFSDARGQVTHLDGDSFSLVPVSQWISPGSGARYPSGWQLAVPSLGLELAAEPVIRDQELDTRPTTGVFYWEGAVDVQGTENGRPIAGHGYVELTGYAHGLP